LKRKDIEWYPSLETGEDSSCFRRAPFAHEDVRISGPTTVRSSTATAATPKKASPELQT